MPEEFSELQILLRLKRHENPPPGYLEDFLVEFNRRQRVELLRRPLWRIALDRMGNWVPVFPALPVPNLAYAGVSAVALVVAAGLMTRHSAPVPDVAFTNPPVASAVVAAAAPPSRPYGGFSAVAPLAAVRMAPDAEDIFFGSNPNPTLVVPPARGSAVASDRPRYLLDTRPARYEPRSTSF